MAAENVGRVIQIAGPAVDVQFAEGSLPPIYEAVRVVSEGFKGEIPVHVAVLRAKRPFAAFVELACEFQPDVLIENLRDVKKVLEIFESL